MFAIVKSGGKQYRVEEGDVLRLESLEAEVQWPSGARTVLTEVPVDRRIVVTETP